MSSKSGNFNCCRIHQSTGGGRPNPCNSLILAPIVAFAAVLSVASTICAAPPLLPVPVSTIPSNGDTNPYGIIFVYGTNGGSVQNGDVLVANFNNSSGVMGLGTTIVDIRNGKQLATPFYSAPAEYEGLNPFVQLGDFFVIGNLPLISGTTAGAGALRVLNRSGAVVNTITDPHADFIDGPWGLVTTIPSDFLDVASIPAKGVPASIYVSNVLNGTVWRLDGTYNFTNGFALASETQIAGGYGTMNDFPTAINGPAGLVYYRPEDKLFVASEVDNEIFAIDDASKRGTTTTTGTVIYSDSTHLHGPTGLKLLANSHLLTSNDDGINENPADPSELVEFTRSGVFVTQYSVDPTPGGAFGIDSRSHGHHVLLTYDDDNTDTASILSLFLP
jgi:hypothetical protein